MKLTENIRVLSLKNIFLLSLLTTVLMISACGEKNNQSQSSGSVFSSDDTEEAVALITEANVELKKIKKIYRENEGRIEEIQIAMSNKENEKVKKIADDLVFKINDGLVLADKAIIKINEAKSLNINSTFREYLERKSHSLDRQRDAFEYRRQAAELLSKGFGSNDPKQIEGIRAVFKEKDVEFQKAWQEGRDESLEANDFYKESLQKPGQ